MQDSTHPKKNPLAWNFSSTKEQSVAVRVQGAVFIEKEITQPHRQTVGPQSPAVA